MFVTFKCDDCGHEQQHPSMLRSNPRCDKCFGPMTRRPDAAQVSPTK